MKSNWRYLFIGVILAFLVLIPRAVSTNENFDVRNIDEARNHLVVESMPAVYSIEVRGKIFKTDTKEVVQENILFGTGTGFGVSADGLVFTKMHVVNPYFGEMSSKIVAPNVFEYQNGFSIEVSLVLINVSGTTNHARIVAGDPIDKIDLALLQITVPHRALYPHLEILDELPGYDGVITIGNPFGITFSVGEGIVSNPDANVNGKHMLQTTALALPGSSGGPIIRLRDHKVVGMVESIYTLVANAGVDLGFGTPSIIEIIPKTPACFDHSALLLSHNSAIL